MRNLVLNVFSKFGKTLVVALWNKDRVVAKALRSRFFGGDIALYPAFKLMFLAVDNQRNHRAEVGFPVCCIAQFTEQFAHIGFAVVVGMLVVACRMHTRFAVKGIYFKPRVVGKAIQMIVVVDVMRLYACISFQCFGCFGYIHIAANIL